MFPVVTEAFQSLMRQPQQSDVETAMIVLERFVVLLYDKTSCRSHVNEVRVDLFAYKGRDVLHIPPTQGCLIEHVKRAAYQAGYCWSQSLLPMAVLPQRDEWGWTRTTEGAWEVLWGKLPEASKLCRELPRCGCTKGCRKIVNVKKLHCPAQLYASVLAHVSNHVNSILFHSIIIITICTHVYNSLYFIYVQLTQ